MNLRHLFLLLSLNFVLPAFAQTLLPGRYAETAFRPSSRDRASLSINVETNGLADFYLSRVNPITGSVLMLGVGSVVNRPNGVVAGRIPGRAYFRGYITETNTVRGRTIHFTPGRAQAVARRFELTHVGMLIPVTPPRPIPMPPPTQIPWTNSVPLPPLPPPIYATNPPPATPIIPVRVEAVSMQH